MSEQTHVQVAIIGSGIAGLAAANAAWEAGARSILVIESQDVVGGSSRLSGGIVIGAGVMIGIGLACTASGITANIAARVVAANRRTLDAQIGWAYEQQLIGRQPALDEFFWVPPAAAAD